MSKINDLKENPTNNINLVDFYSLFCPEDKPKYLELLFKVLGNKRAQEIGGTRKALSDLFNIPILELSKFDDNQMSVLVMILLQDGVKNLTTFKTFCDYCERGVIVNKDVTSYKSFDQIENSVVNAEQKIFQKELEKEVKMIYEDDEWVVVRPLTYLSSCKYGANTKWCTASSQTSSHFTSYTQAGALIYSVNKKRKLKVATYQRFDGIKEITFWDAKDIKTDALSVNLPFEILKIIKCELDTYPVPNSQFVNDETKEKINRLNAKQRIAESVSIGNGRRYEQIMFTGMTTHLSGLTGFDGFETPIREVINSEDNRNSLGNKLAEATKFMRGEGQVDDRSGGQFSTSGSSGVDPRTGLSGTSGSSGISGSGGTSLPSGPNINLAKTTAFDENISSERVALSSKKGYRRNEEGIKEFIDGHNIITIKENIVNDAIILPLERIPPPSYKKEKTIGQKKTLEKSNRFASIKDLFNSTKD